MNTIGFEPIGRCYCVTCLDDSLRVLATRTIFKDRGSAEEYAKTINAERNALTHEVKSVVVDLLSVIQLPMQ